MADFEVCFDFLCVMCVAPVKMHCQLVKVYGVCVIPWKQADTVHGFQQWQDRCWQVVTWAPTISTTDDAWCTDASAADFTRELDIHRLVHRIVLDKLNYREVYAYWGPKNPTDDDKTHCTSLSCIHWTCYTDEREQFWSLNMVNYTKPETRKRTCDRETIIFLQQKKWKHCDW